MKKFWSGSYLALILFFIYIPITVLIIFSFNDEKSLSSFAWGSLFWYKQLVNDRSLIESIISSLLVATISTIVAVIIGTFAAIGLSKSSRVTKNITLSVSNIPIINADIVTAVSLMMLFFSLGFNFGIFSLIMAHISFNIPYAIITILPRLKKVRNELIEASLDLGASPWFTLRKIILPLIRPAIIGAAAICFAMSFDDFIISYFTGGSTTNVATYIYTLRRITPTIAAFGTILISIVSFVIISWNGYRFIKMSLSIRNDKILKGKYRDKKVIKMENYLVSYYLKLNSLKRKLKYETNDFLMKRIYTLENKLEKEQQWLNDTRIRIIGRRNNREKLQEKMREKYYWLTKVPWRFITIISIAFGSLGLLTALYIKNNIYDLKLGIWSDYISDKVINEFEKEHNIKIKKETYDSNEMLYSKMATTNYDLVVPSEYMLTKLIDESRIEKLDWNRLVALDNTSINKNIEGYGEFEKYLKQYPLNNKILLNYMNYDLGEKMARIQLKGDNQGENFIDYAIPYFWGDLTIIFNLEKPKNKDWLQDKGIKFNDNGDIDEDTLSWDIIFQAAKDNKNIFLNNDIKNLYAIAFQKINQGVSPNNKQEVKQATELLEELIINHKKNVTLQNDEIIDSVNRPYNKNTEDQLFDVAFMYNGDAVSTFLDKEGDVQERKFVVSRPRKKDENNNKPYSTGIWIDSLAITKNSQNKDLAYKFIQFLMKDKIQMQLSSEMGYTSAIQYALDELTTDDGAFKSIKQVFIPAINKNDDVFTDYLLEEIVDQYNRKILSK